MNILILNYGAGENNSSHHINAFADGLGKRGHDVVVGERKGIPDGEAISRGHRRICSHATLLESGAPFQNGRGADILHLWTPREYVRKFARKYRKKHEVQRMVIHLEDNEVAIFERFTGEPIADCKGTDRDWPTGMIHPDHYEAFLTSAAGVTCIHRCLEELVPSQMPWIETPPIIDLERFSPGPSAERERLLQEAGLAEDTILVGYTGNDHPASIQDILLLYRALDLLIDQGLNLALARSAQVMEDAYEGVRFRGTNRCREVGFLERAALLDLMRGFDLVVQPGNDDAFNRNRLPAKIPEYLALGLPLVMGPTNIAAELESQKAAMVLEMRTPEDLASAIKELVDTPDKRKDLGRRAREFAAKRFQEDSAVSTLERFYQACLSPTHTGQE